MIYFDNSATTRPCEEAVAAVTELLRDCWGNPSSLHNLGMDAASRQLGISRSSQTTGQAGPPHHHHGGGAPRRPPSS